MPHIQMMIGWHADSVAHRGRGRFECAALLVGFIVSGGPVSAQDPTIELMEAGQPAEALFSATVPLGTRHLFASAIGTEQDIFGPPRRAVLLPRIDWLDESPEAEAADGALSRLPPLAFQQTAAQHPEPARTGFKALVFETGRDFKRVPAPALHLGDSRGWRRRGRNRVSSGRSGQRPASRFWRGWALLRTGEVHR